MQYVLLRYPWDTKTFGLPASSYKIKSCDYKVIVCCTLSSRAAILGYHPHNFFRTHPPMVPAYPSLEWRLKLLCTNPGCCHQRRICSIKTPCKFVIIAEHWYQSPGLPPSFQLSSSISWWRLSWIRRILCLRLRRQLISMILLARTLVTVRILIRRIGLLHWRAPRRF